MTIDLKTWWAWTERIRALAEVPFQVDFHQVRKQPLCQEIAATALHLKQLGLSTSTIARRLNVGY